MDDLDGGRCSLASEGKDSNGGRGLADEGRHGGEAHKEIRTERGGGTFRVEGRGDGGIAKRTGAWRLRGGRYGHDAAEGRRLG
ncbi:unnamed protein product [Urochloa humidicola]